MPRREAVCTIFMMVFGMTRPRGELTTYRARGGHATDWANPTRSVRYEHMKLVYATHDGQDKVALTMVNMYDLNHCQCRDKVYKDTFLNIYLKCIFYIYVKIYNMYIKRKIKARINVRTRCDFVHTWLFLPVACLHQKPLFT